MSNYDDNIDELDLAETVAEMNPTSDQLQHLANLHAIKHEMLNRQAPFSRTNPPSVLKGTLGNQYSFSPGEQKQVAAWTGEDAETLPVSICFAKINDPNTPRNVNWCKPYGVGIIQFGTKSSLLTAEVDIGLGCQLTVPASMVTLQIRSVPRTIAALAVDPFPMIFSGMLSFNPILRTQPVTRTVFSDDPLALATSFRIPAFAKSLRVVKRDAAQLARQAIITFFDDDFGPCGYFVIAAATQQADSFMVPPNATSFTITDAIAVNIGCAAIFELEF